VRKKQKDVSLTNKLEKHLKGYRILLFFSALGIPPAKFIFMAVQPDLIDPMSIRLLLSGIALLFILLTYMDRFKKYTYATGYIWVIIAATYTLWFFYINSFAANTALPIMLGLLNYYLILYRSKKDFTFIIFLTSAIYIFFGVIVSNPEINRYIYFTFSSIGIILVTIIVNSRIDIEKALDQALEAVNKEKDYIDTQSKSLLNNMGDAVIITSAEGKIIHANKAFEKWSRNRQEKFLGYKFNEVFKTYDLKEKEVDPETTSDQKIYANNIVTLRCLLQNTKSEEAKKHPVKIVATSLVSDGSKIGTIRIIHDQSEEYYLEKKEKEFLSIASHELRTPLTSIRGNTSMIIEYFGNTINKNKDLKDMIQDTYDSSIRLINIVEDFLDVARFEQSKIKFLFEKLGINNLIEKSIKEVEVSAKEKNLKIIFKKPSSTPKIWADKNRAKQVIINLLGNAIKFSSKGEIKINVSTEGSFVKVSVSDDGQGIDPKNQNRLFSKFTQASEEYLTRDATQGTGLGLYVSKLITEGMGGKIYLDKSEKGKGSTFAFTLPMYNDKLSSKANKI